MGIKDVVAFFNSKYGLKLLRFYIGETVNAYPIVYLDSISL